MCFFSRSQIRQLLLGRSLLPSPILARTPRKNAQPELSDIRKNTIGILLDGEIPSRDRLGLGQGMVLKPCTVFARRDAELVLKDVAHVGSVSKAGAMGDVAQGQL